MYALALIKLLLTFIIILIDAKINVFAEILLKLITSTRRGSTT
jgi:hypothetical protein